MQCNDNKIGEVSNAVNWSKKLALNFHYMTSYTSSILYIHTQKVLMNKLKALGENDFTKYTL